MSKIIFVKLTRAGENSGPFSIYDEFGNLVAENVSRKTLIGGVGYSVNDDVTLLKIVSTGECKYEKVREVEEYQDYEFFNTPFQQSYTSCIWRHLKNPEIYNTYYNTLHPYIIEYPFAYQYHDEITQNIKDYTKVYKYTSDVQSVSNETNKVAVDNIYFTRAILYNDQQCSGVLRLKQKPKNNLKEYNAYPKYNSDSKDITFTKSDNFYNFNTFWDVIIDKSQPIFKRTCENLSVYKQLNQSNMDYSPRSFKKAPLRAKDLRVRMIFDDGRHNIVSQFIVNSAQISYK